MPFRSSFRAAAAAVCVFAELAGAGGGAHAGPVVEAGPDIVNFDNNQLPLGWSVWTGSGSPGRQYGIRDGRFNVDQVDSTFGVTRAFNPTGVQSVKIEYDANVANVYWGQGSAAGLYQNLADYRTGTGNAVVNLAKNGYGQYQMNSGISYLPVDGAWRDLYRTSSSPIFGEYHITGTFEDGRIGLSVINNSTNQTFANHVQEVPGFQLSTMNDLMLHAVTTTGASAYIDNIKVTTTCVPPKVLQGNACVTLGPRFVGELPTPDTFTSRIADFARNNSGLLSTIAAQNGNSAFAVAGSTQQLLNPASEDYLKNIAGSAATNLAILSDGISGYTAYYSAKVAAVTSGVTGALKEIGRSLLVAAGFEVAGRVANESGIDAVQKAVLLAELDQTILSSCVDSIQRAPAPLRVAFLVACDAELIAFDIKHGLVPYLELYNFDPPNPNYTTAVVVNMPSVDLDGSDAKPAIESLLAAQVYLGAVNETYDRYVSAYVAGDVDSSLLQI